MTTLTEVQSLIAQIHEDYNCGRITAEEARDLIASCDIINQIESSSDDLAMKTQVNTALTALISVVGAVA